MFAATSPSDQATPQRVAHQRVNAAATVSFKAPGKRTRLDRLYQQGSAKIRFPKVYSDEIEAVLINTAGGLTGGDQLSWDIDLGESAKAVISTQACEKGYRSSQGIAQVTTSLKLAAGASLHWLPQETILYDGCALSRQFTVEMAEGATLLAIETIVSGREAMGEKINGFSFHDRWRISRNGNLVFADDFHLNDRAEQRALLNGNGAVTSLVYIGDNDDERLELLAKELRDICPAAASGFSAFEGKLTGRIAAKDSYQLRGAIAPVLKHLRGADLPKVWRI